MERIRKHKKLILILLLLLLAIGGGLFWHHYNKPTPPNPNLDGSAVGWQGRQVLEEAGKGSDETISIPCFESLAFQANQTTQKVNLYNPENNKCYFVITMIVGEDTVFKSEMIAPNTGFYEIELSKELAAGEYSGMVIYECFSIADLSPMNGGSFHFDLVVR